MVKPRVYFYCCDEPGNLQEDVIALAEGLKVLGVPFYANCNYWLQSTELNDYLFRHDPDVGPDDCDIVVVSYTWAFWVRMGDFVRRRQPLPQDLFKASRRYVTVAMDNHDGYRTISWEPEYRQFDLVLRTKFNNRAFAPANTRPWAYGWTNRIIEATAGAPPFAARVHRLLVNFGVSHGYAYGSRDLAARRLEPQIDKVIKVDRTTDDLRNEPADPYEALMWRQTGGRFSRSYYERLKQSTTVACFCGDIIPSLPWKPDAYLVGGNRARIRRAAYTALSALSTAAPRAVGADSFRFWEALAAGCAALNIDLDHYGVEMPVMPTNGVHYLGVDFSRVSRVVEQIRDDAAGLEAIAYAGREWAQTYYSPAAAAQRLLTMAGLNALGDGQARRQSVIV